MSNTSTHPNQAAQAAAQAAQAALQAAKAKAQANDPLGEDPADATPSESDEQLAKAWGFSVKRPKLSREAIIGVVAIVALLGLFGYVAVKTWNNRSTVAEAPTKVDPDVQTAANSETQKDAPAVDELKFDDPVVSKSSTISNGRQDLDFGADPLDVGTGQSEPVDNRVTSKKLALPRNLDEEFDTFGDNGSSTVKVEEPASKSLPPDDMLDFGNDTKPAGTNRTSAALEFDDPPAQPEPPLTKSTEPLRLKQPDQTPPDEEFLEPRKVVVAQKPDDGFETVPPKTRRPAEVAQKDLFAESPMNSTPRSAISPTTNHPAPTNVTKATHHPLLRDGEYLVEKGDNFCVISKKLYGTESYYLALAEHNRNRVADPCRMMPGLVILAPSREVLEKAHPNLIPKPKGTTESKDDAVHTTRKAVAAALPPGLFYDEHGAPWYRVGKGDTLSGIAQAHLGRSSRMEQIFNLNRERLRDRNDLQVGQELRLPNDASQVRLTDLEKSHR
jgi:nucleoid-associated protein YgaU